MKALIVVALLAVSPVFAASSQGMKCQHLAGVAEDMERDFKTTEFRPEHFKNPDQQALGKLVERCMKDGLPVKDCIISFCMGSKT